MNTTYIKSYKEMDYNYNEIFRYLKMNKPSDEIYELITSCICELKGKLQYKVCYSEYPLTLNKSFIDLGFATTTSSNLAKNLEGCNSIILMAATLGLELDRLIKKYSISSPSRALILQAIGTERVEALCNTFYKDISSQKQILGHLTKPRYSPGYGDLALELQTNIFETLNCYKNIGLTLNDSLLMIPTKSVTAIIGVI